MNIWGGTWPSQAVLLPDMVYDIDEKGADYQCLTKENIL